MGQKIKYLRESKGYNQEYVARESGISQPAYSRYEADKVTRFIPVHIEGIAKALGTTKEYLMETQDRLEHYPEHLQRWLELPTSLEYVKKAYIEYVKDN